jgi:hypothetical protein
MKVVKPDAVPAEPANSPLFTGGPVTRQTLLTPEMSNNFNLAIVNFSAGARNKNASLRMAGGQIFTYDIRSARMLKPLLRAERSKGERRVFQQPVESLTQLRRLTLRILDSPDTSLSRLSTGFG